MPKFRFLQKGFILLIPINLWIIATFTENTVAQCTTIDQSQLNYNGGMSARNLPGYSEWQNFTANATGTLCQIDVGLFNFMSGTGTFKIFNGAGTGGSLLQSQTVTISGTGNFFFTFSVAVPVVAGSVYTFQLIPIQGGGLPDPYGVQVESPGTYAGGELNIVDPSGTYPTGFDMVFKTYVTVSTNVNESVVSINGISITPNPFQNGTKLSFDKTLNDATITLFDQMGQSVKTISHIYGNEIILLRDNLPSGIYFIKLSDRNKKIFYNKFVIID